MAGRERITCARHFSNWVIWDSNKRFNKALEKSDLQKDYRKATSASKFAKKYLPLNRKNGPESPTREKK